MGLDPSTEEARRLLEQELAKGKYAGSQPGLLERFWTWFLGLFHGAGSGVGAPAWLVPVVLLIVFALIGLILWRVLRREPAQTTTTAVGAVLDGVSASAAELRQSAITALAAGDADTAVLDGYRTIVVAAIERTLLDDQPGRTAHEAARDLGPVFPGESSALSEGADVFDAVRYGGRAATPEQARAIIDLDDRLRSTRPNLAEALATPW